MLSRICGAKILFAFARIIYWEHVLESLIQAAGAIGVQVDDATTERFRRYRELLIEWGSRANLTAIKDPEAIVERLFIRSFRIAVQAGGSVTTAGWFDGRRIIDIGSGAGIPGLPLKLILPEADVTLLEANRKKCDFMEHVVADLGLGWHRNHQRTRRNRRPFRRSSRELRSRYCPCCSQTPSIG